MRLVRPRLRVRNNGALEAPATAAVTARSRPVSGYVVDIRLTSGLPNGQSNGAFRPESGCCSPDRARLGTPCLHPDEAPICQKNRRLRRFRARRAALTPGSGTRAILNAASPVSLMCVPVTTRRRRALPSFVRGIALRARTIHNPRSVRGHRAEGVSTGYQGGRSVIRGHAHRYRRAPMFGPPPSNSPRSGSRETAELGPHRRVQLSATRSSTAHTSSCSAGRCECTRSCRSVEGEAGETRSTWLAAGAILRNP